MGKFPELRYFRAAYRSERHIFMTISFQNRATKTPRRFLTPLLTVLVFIGWTGASAQNGNSPAAAQPPKAAAQKKKDKKEKDRPRKKQDPAAATINTTGVPAPGTPEAEEYNRVKFQIMNMFGRDATVPPRETWKDYPQVTGKILVEMARDVKYGQQQRMASLFSLSYFPDTPGGFETCRDVATDSKESKFYRDAAMGCLVEGHPGKAVSILKDLAGAPELQTRLSAVSGLTKIKSKEADTVLEKLLPKAQEPLIRQLIEQRLKEAKGS